MHVLASSTAKVKEKMTPARRKAGASLGTVGAVVGGGPAHQDCGFQSTLSRALGYPWH